MRIFSLLVLTSFLFAGCGDDDESTDSGLPDTGLLDTALDVTRPDAGALPDSLDGGVEDAGVDAGGDAGVGIDGGADAGPEGPCVGLEIGTACPCADPFICSDDGRCVPGGGRPTCGGFAGAMCTARTFPECAFEPGSDFGPCLSTEEKACVCAEHSDLYPCAAMRD